jgi:hypothetical protein
MIPAPISVDLYISRKQNIFHASSLYAGLDRLQRRGAINVTFKGRPPGERFVENQGVVCLRVTKPGSPEARELAIDLFDMSDEILPSVLERCDVYFKRSFHAPDLASIAPELRAKIRPFGLTFPVRTEGSTRRVIAKTAVAKILRETAGLRVVYNYLNLPLLPDLERSPVDEVDPSIVFQPRAWSPEETAPGEHMDINGRRVEIVRALRSAFGDRFRGGLVPTDYARSLYPDALTPLSSRHRRYAAMSARNLIGVYTRGLHHSTAFKLAEYLAAAQCIVSEVPRNELPVPLQPGVHFLPFDSSEECVDACRRLLADADLAARMRAANHDYYLKQVEPAAHMMHAIDTGLTH